VNRSVAAGVPFTAMRTEYAPGGAIGPCVPPAQRIMFSNELASA
jgi:hypothetical protein